MKSLAFLLFVSSAQLIWCDVSSEKPLLLRHPAINRAQIVFVFANDLWSVSRDGGEAVRLTTGVGMETDPIFSRTDPRSLSRVSTTAISMSS